MTTVKRPTDLTAYASVLPYASELSGVYQPLLGWKSVRIENRFREGLERDKPQVIERLERKFAGLAELRLTDDNRLDIQLAPGIAAGGRLRSTDSLVIERVAAGLPPIDEYEPSVWDTVITTDRIDGVLRRDVVDFYTKAYESVRDSELPGTRRSTGDGGTARVGALTHQLQFESAMAGALLHLARGKHHDALKEIFYASRDDLDAAEQLAKIAAAEHPVEAYLELDHMDPGDAEHMRSVALSPIGVVHLFRQYFFELDTFLGTPESHVWLTPGSSVELIEVHTRRATVERTLETALDVLTRTETVTVEQEEISEAVKAENQRDTKLGASVTASYASVQATSSLDLSTSQSQARETTHKRTRQQTETASSEIRKSFKSTFKTLSEITDISSSKHLLANTSDVLVNYELRRKMRQVGVQLQDVGTYLCWQAYIDDPGKALGIAKLVHLAKPAELDAIPHPEEIPPLQPFQEEQLVTIPFVSIEDTGADSAGEVYVDGVEVDDSEWQGNLEKIQADFTQEFVCDRAGYVLSNVEFDAQGHPVSASRRSPITNANGRASFVLHLDSADFQGKNSLQLKLVLHWAPTAEINEAIAVKNQENVAGFKAAERVAHERAFVETVRDRVTLASKIATRRPEDLRDEERIVVYRALIQELLLKGVELPDDRTRHVVAEVVNSIFDVEKMLYFVAPEWWRPRLHRSRQELHERPPKRPNPFDVGGKLDGVLTRGWRKRAESASLAGPAGAMSASSVGWGGTNDPDRDNYYITDESDPARLGSSLGWLLQLDGDSMRNAFLNAPWVKTVIPVRPGKEKAAINWLKGVEGMNGITDDAVYHTASPDEVDVDGQPLDGQPMIAVLEDLAERIRRNHAEGNASGTFPTQDEVSDPALVNDDSTVSATPVDRVYEHGFFPLAGGFRLDVTKPYELFDQWIEILPTDQTVPVEVEYDPKTGRQL
jgi:hypothetical protein